MLMGGLFGRFAGSLCGDLGLSTSVSGQALVAALAIMKYCHAVAVVVVVVTVVGSTKKATSFAAATAARNPARPRPHGTRTLTARGAGAGAGPGGRGSPMMAIGGGILSSGTWLGKPLLRK